jgi:hypothetical protein
MQLGSWRDDELKDHSIYTLCTWSRQSYKAIGATVACQLSAEVLSWG